MRKVSEKKIKVVSLAVTVLFFFFLFLPYYFRGTIEYSRFTSTVGILLKFKIRRKSESNIVIRE